MMKPQYCPEGGIGPIKPLKPHDELSKEFDDYVARASAAVTQGEAHREFSIPVAPPPALAGGPDPSNPKDVPGLRQPSFAGWRPPGAATSNPKDVLGLRKPPLRLVPPALLIFVAKVMGLGARKYGAYNWRTLRVRKLVYIEAAMRHLMAVIDGEDTDPESGMPHEAHVAACMGILLDAQALGVLIDDRPPKGPAAALIVEHTEVA